MDQIENLPELQETLFRKGFPKELADSAAEKALSGQVEITEEHLTTVNEDEVGYQLHFKADQEKAKVYLNSYDAALFNHPDGMREQNIAASTLITAAEAHRMLKYGKLVAVNKNLFNKEGVKYNTWLRFDVSGPKDENGNYPVETYHEKYYKKKAFDVKECLQNLHVPVKDLENPRKLDDFERDLKKAHIIEVTILHNNQEQPGFLCVNPKVGDVQVYDSDMKLIPRPKQEVKAHQNQQASPAPGGDEKKKPVANRQGTSWPQSKGQSKGMSR